MIQLEQQQQQQKRALARVQDVCWWRAMRGGSLPGQVCVIVAVTNMIITGRWEREEEEEEEGGRERGGEERGRVLALLHAGNKLGHLATSQQSGSGVNSEFEQS